VKPNSLIRLYPRQWRERYGEEVRALLEDRPTNFRDSADLILNCLREWERNLQVTRIFLPAAVSFTANAIGWFLRDSVGRLALVDAAFPGVLVAWIVTWILVCVRLAPSYWRWLSAPLHLKQPPLPKFSTSETRWVVATGLIVGIVVPWNAVMPREWWSFLSNPSFPMLMITYGIISPIQKPAPYGSTIASSKRPPKAPLGLA
jgi:hypothetical protein